MALPRIDHKLFGLVIPSTKQKIMVRQMLVREEKILLIGSQSDDDAEIFSSIKQCVNNCVVDPENFDIDELTIFDLEYIFLKLRALSINNVTTVAYVDDEDQKTYKFDINLDDIEVKWPENTNNTFKVTDEVAFTLRYPKADMYDDRGFIDYDGDPYFLLTCKCLDKVYDGDEAFDVKGTPAKEIEEFVNNLTPSIYDEIKDFFKSQPSITHTITYTNANGTERKIVLSTLTDFFTLR